MESTLKSNRKIIHRLLIWVVIALLVTVSGAVILLTQPLGERVLANFLEAKLSSVFQRSVQIGSLETNLFSRLRISDLLIQDADTAHPDTLLYLKEARTAFRLGRLLQREIYIDDIVLTNLDLNIAKDTAGKLNLPAFPVTGARKRPDAKKFTPIIKELRLSGGYLSYLDQSSDLNSIEINNLGATLDHEDDAGYRYTVHTDTNRISYAQSSLDIVDLFFAGTINGTALEVDSLQFSLPGMIMTGNCNAAFSEDDTLVNAKLLLEGNPVELAASLKQYLPEVILPVSGDLRLALSASGRLSQPNIQCNLTAPDLQMGALHLDALLLDGQFEAGVLYLRQLEARTLGGYFGISGEVYLDSINSYSSSILVSDFQVSEIWRLFYESRSPYQGKIEGHLSARGNLKNVTQTSFDANVRVKNVYYQQKRISDFEAIATIGNGAANLQFRGEGVMGDAEVQYSKTDLSGSFEVEFDHLKHTVGLLNIPGLTGSLQMGGELSGSMENPIIQAAIRADRIKYQGFPLDSLRSTIHYSRKQLTIEDLVFGGRIQLPDTVNLPLEIRDFSGSCVYQGKISGTPDQFQGKIIAEFVDPAFKTLHFAEGYVDIILDQDKITLSKFDFLQDTLSVYGNADFSLENYDGTASVALRDRNFGTLATLEATYDLAALKNIALQTEIVISDLTPLGYYLPKAPATSGAMVLSLNATGLPDKPAAAAVAHFNNLNIGAAHLDSVSATMHLNPNELTLESLNFYLGNHHSWMTASLDLNLEKGKPVISDEGKFTGEAHGNLFPLAVLNPFLPYSVSLGGTSVYDLRWTGTLKNILPSGTVRFDSASVVLNKINSEFHHIDMYLKLESDVVILDSLSGFFGDIPLFLKARVTTPDRRQFDLNTEMLISDSVLVSCNGIWSPAQIDLTLVTDDVQLAVLQPFLPQIQQLNGRLHSRIDLTGSLSDPRIDGFIDVTQLSLKVPELDHELLGGKARLRFDRSTAWLDSFSLRLDDDGWISAQGRLSHENLALKDVDLTISLRNIKHTEHKKLSMNLKSAEFHYFGEADKLQLDGDIVFGKTKILADFQPQTLLPFAQKVQKPAPEWPEYIAKTRLELRIKDSQEIWIDNNIARLRLHPEMEISGTPTQINLAGRTTVEEGYLLFLDRKFKITQGIVDFIDPDRINPIVDLQAQTSVRNYQALEATTYSITLTITGPMDETVVELTSDPPLEETDIISLLTLGATRQQLTGKTLEGEEPSRTEILLDRAGELSSQKISGYLSRNLTSVTGLDNVSIEGNLFNFGKSWGPQLVASKKISERMEVTYTTNVGHFNEKSIRVDYRLTKSFWVESETDQIGNAGIDLKYKIGIK
ncbi:translocation/assembly module TamB domain-containing protein [bacterium]|nr:translocation/assembly module TamB domain-containing protein [bacterium]